MFVKKSFHLQQHCYYVVHVNNHTGVPPVTFSDWERINAEEIKMGEHCGKPREKIVSVENMLDTVCRSRKTAPQLFQYEV